ncbi:MAG: T9SS type A sorting domain-containing protein [Bacteroidia bacterium]|nr:T9SS type A sorting domain-containing protein [Bacteroidia bacterium]
MKKLLFAFCLISLFGTSQNLAFQWAKNLGAAGNESGQAVVADGSGNVYSTGVFVGTSDFDPGAGTFTIASSAASQDIYISKLDALGNFVWAKSIGGIGSDAGISATLDGLGNVFITGYFNGTVDFDPSAAVFNLTSSGSQDIFVLALNSAGAFVGAVSMGGTGSDQPYAIALDVSGNIYTTGFYTGVADFDPGASNFNLTSAGGPDIFVSKLSSTGTFVWAKSLGGSSSNEEGHGIKIDASNNVYVTGFFAATADFDPGAAVFNLTSNGSSDIFVSKLNSLGNFVWAKQMGGASAEKSYWLNLDASGNVYTTGFFSATADFDPGVGSANLTATGSNDIFVSKLDASGNYVWAKAFVGTTFGSGNSIAIDASNNVYITGFFQGTVDFDPGVGTFNVTSSGSLDAFISKLDALGNYVTTKTFGGTGADNSTSLALDASANVITTGYFAATPDFDPGVGTYTLTAGGSGDAFVHKMSPCTLPASPVNITAPGNLNTCANNSTTLTTSSSGTVSWYASPTSTTVLSTGLSYITSTLATGTYTYYAEAFTCLNSATRTAISVTVNPTPTITVNSGSICNGSSFTVVPNGASSYLYMNSTTGSSCIINPSSTINFSLIGTSVAGCTSTATSTIAVGALPNININSSTGGPSLCSGSSATLFAGGASTYTWVAGPNTSTYAISPTVFTTYTVIGTSSLGCSSSNTISMGILTTPTINISAVSSSICSGNSTTLNASGANSYLWNTSATTSSISVSPLSTTIYTVTGTILSCSSTETISINVTASPTISIANTASVICAGGSATLSIIGAAASYSWSTGPTTTTLSVSPTVNTTYTAAGFNGSCYGLATTTISISNSITVNVSSSSSSICVGQSATLTANGASSYTWSTGSNTTSIVVTPTTSTSYSVSGSSGACNGSAITAVAVNLCTGIHQNINDFQFSIYPNPNNGIINIDIENSADLQITDLLGKMVLEITLQKFNNTLNISNLSNGLYYFKIKQGDTVAIKKIIKQ